MNIVITGALGHIGSGLIRKISQVKNLKKVYLIDNASSNNLNVLFKLNCKKIKFKFIHDDLINRGILKSINDKIDAIHRIHPRRADADCGHACRFPAMRNVSIARGPGIP